MLFELDEDMLRDDLGVASRLSCRKILNRRGRLAPIMVMHDASFSPVRSTTVLDTSFSTRPTSQLGSVIAADELRRLHAHDPHDSVSEVLEIDLRRGVFGVEEARELVDLLELVGCTLPALVCGVLSALRCQSGVWHTQVTRISHALWFIDFTASHLGKLMCALWFGVCRMQ
jgi:hypothetical protein